jgi:flagellar protein FliT
MEHLILDCYDSMGAASARMLDAAIRGDWDALVAAEHECSAIIGRLKTLGDTNQLSDSGTLRKMGIIRKVLSEDAQIREFTQPWMRTIETLLCGKFTERRVQSTYG